MRHRALYLGIIGCLGLVGGLVASLSSGPRARDTVSVSARSLASGSRPEAKLVANARRYDLHASYEVALSQDRQASSLGVTLDGAWALVTLNADADGVLLRSELTARVLLSQGGQPPAINAEVAAELAKPHYIALAPDGQIVRFGFAPDQSAAARGIIRSLASSIQLVRGATPDRWEVEEADANGRFVAGYVQRGSNIGKRKLRYVAGNATVTQLASETAFELGDDALPRSITTEETMSTATAMIAATTKSRVSLRLAQTGTVEVTPGVPGGYDTVTVGDEPATPASSDRELLAGATYDDLLGELESAGERGLATISLRFAALLRLQPAVAEQVAERIRAKADQRTTSVLLGALGKAGHAEAQQALIGLLDERALADRSQVAVAMAMVDQPSPALTDALTGKLDDGDLELRSTSSLALAAAAARLARTNAAQSTAIVDDLLARLDAATDEEQRIMLVRALGTIGDARALPAIRVAAASTEPRMRRVAVEALRSIADPTVDSLLAYALLNDREPNVRRAAVFAATFRPLTLLAAFDTALRQDSDENVRLAIVELLVKQPASNEVATVLARVAQADTSADVREAALRR